VLFAPTSGRLPFSAAFPCNEKRAFAPGSLVLNQVLADPQLFPFISPNYARGIPDPVLEQLFSGVFFFSLRLQRPAGLIHLISYFPFSADG